MRVLWVKAPFVLRRHPALLGAVLACAALAAVAASAPPFVRAGVESESLRGELATMSPLSAGLDIDVLGNGKIAGDRGRRVAAAALAQHVPSLGRPVVSSRLPVQVATGRSAGLDVVALARTDAVAHVRHVTATTGSGVWIADTTAEATGLAPGELIGLTEFGMAASRPRTVTFRVKGVYASLAGDAGNPYWTNWVHEIRSLGVDSPDPPAFVLMSEGDLERLATNVAPSALNRYEFPVDPTRITFTGAERLTTQLGRIGRIATHSRAIGCTTPNECQVSTSLDAALIVARRDVAAVSPTISLLSNCALAIALGLAVAAGTFLVRRRADEVHALVARGEAPAMFGARVALESLLPALLGGAAGIGLAYAALRVFARSGTIDGGTFTSGTERAAVAIAAAVAAIAVGAGVSFSERAVRTARLPWELVPLCAAAVLLLLAVTGHGVGHDANGSTHPRLAVFLLPVTAAIGCAGLATRTARRLLRRRGAGTGIAVFLALRRVAAARGALVVVVVAAAASFGTFAYASTLRASLARSVAEKAYVSTGSDVQGIVDPADEITSPFPFPAAIVELDQSNVSFASGARVDLIAGDPHALARTIEWGHGFGGDPRPLLPRLERPAPSGVLLALATPDSPPEDAIVDQGVRIPIQIVGRADFPGQAEGRPALVVSRAALRRIAHHVGILDPGPLASGLVWAKGRPSAVEPALVRSNLAVTYLTTRNVVLRATSVTAAGRSYRYVEAIGVVSAVLSLLGLLLYLHARQRSQLIASLFARRMGLRRSTDTAAVALEAAVLLLLAGVVGAAAAVATAAPIVRHVDMLPQYAPRRPASALADDRGRRLSGDRSGGDHRWRGSSVRNAPRRRGGDSRCVTQHRSTFAASPAPTARPSGRRRRCTPSTRRSRRGRSTPSSGRPAAARRPCCGCSPGSTGPTPAAIVAGAVDPAALSQRQRRPSVDGSGLSRSARRGEPRSASQPARAPRRRRPTACRVARARRPARRAHRRALGRRTSTRSARRRAVRDTPIVLVDEPTAELDHHAAELVIGALARAAAAGRTVVVATHDPELIARAGRRST